MATIARVTTQDALGFSATATASATYPAATTQGNLLIATAFGNISADTLLITGWTKRLSNVGSGNTVSLFDKIADGTESVITVSGSLTTSKIHIYEYTGGFASGALDGTATASTTATVTLTTGSVTTTNRNALLFATTFFSGAVTAVSATAPFNIRQVDASTRLADADQVVSAKGTYSCTINWTTASNSRSIIAAYVQTPVQNNYQSVKVGDGMSTTERIR